MKFLYFLSIILIMGMALFSAGCTSSEHPAKNSTPVATPAGGPPDGKTEGNNISGEKADSERYYYNIKIVPPDSLKNLEREIGTGEYLIHNDNGDLIGIVSPQFLYLRGDLVQLQQKKETGSGRQFDKTDIAEHLVDIAFGFDNSKLALFKSDKDYKFWFDAYYTTDDLDTVRAFARELNSLSDSTQFEDEEVEVGFLMNNYAEAPYNFYNIRIMPAEMLDEFKDERKDTDHLVKDQNGTLIGIIGFDHLYLLKSLTEKDREYYIWKGVLYSMGLHGTSFNDRESFFYRESSLNRNMSSLDTEAVRLLYGGRLKTGMDLEETKKTLGLTT